MLSGVTMEFGGWLPRLPLESRRCLTRSHCSQAALIDVNSE